MWDSRIPRGIYARLYARWRRIGREVDIIESIFRKHDIKRIVEFGCGLGRHGYLLSKRGFEVLLTDIEDQRFGVAKKLPFKTYDLLKGGSIGSFEGGYAVGVITLFEYQDIVRIFRNIRSVIGSGIYVFDYNFTSYTDPERVEVRINGKRYTAILERNSYRPVDGGLVYEYTVRVVDEKGNTVGIENASYPIYSREKIFKAIEQAGYVIKDIVWVSWDPVEYIYRPSGGGSDSAFIAITPSSKASPS